MRLRVLSLIPLFALILAACGGGGSSSSSTTTQPTTSTSAASPPTSAGSDAAATAKAQKLVLVQSDFPTGWTGTPATPDTPEDKAANDEFATCVGSTGNKAQIADVKGDTFNMGSPVTQVGSEAQIAKDDASYHQDVAALKGSKFDTCLQTLLTKALTKAAGSAPTNVQLAPMTLPTFGDVTLGRRMSATLTAAGQSLTIVVDAVVMGKNRAEVTSTFSNLAQPFDQALETSLINKLGAKLTANS